MPFRLLLDEHAGGLVAVVIANIVAFFLVRIVGRNLDA